MMSLPVKMIIRTESTEGLKDIFEKIEEIKKVNPYVVIEPTIEVDLRSGSQLSRVGVNKEEPPTAATVGSKETKIKGITIDIRSGKFGCQYTW